MRPKQPLPAQALSDEVQKIGDTLVEGSDLAVALIATSFLDECLRSLLMARFRPGDTSERLLRSGRGEIGTFSARTDLAYSLEYIDRHALKALRAVAEIRNAFAHSYGEGSFDQREIAVLCSKLDYAYELHVNQWSKPHEKEGIRKELDQFFRLPREQFTYTCVLLGQTLIQVAEGVKRGVGQQEAGAERGKQDS